MLLGKDASPPVHIFEILSKRCIEKLSFFIFCYAEESNYEIDQGHLDKDVVFWE
jgi:hypothetical protein